ncbi:hypothetical protein ABFS82_08G144000 [Erythranthe guttata]|uniref:uncharacterized protein LOC105951484 n=1 Tax=Erythranthe guttata TaxID=4155 RepID=UPI00064DDBA9|nr:PREDICTED: uncharacterized protein LOC105951484 [Erythranthe guttata]|eukprot:XP_012830391.1 PREDICTED: uncharacterized protein LOC105951484 [Erythranthe guttata]
MFLRTYGRRSGGLTRTHTAANSFSDGLSDSSSQEFTQDVYDFTFPSQDSTRCQWSDPYNFGSSQESAQLAFLPSRKSGDSGGGIWKSKKVIDLEPDGSSSSLESKEFRVLEISDGDLQKSKKLKKVNFDPYDYNSSQELEELVVLPQVKGRVNRVSDSYLLNSSQESGDLGVSQSRKNEGNFNHTRFDGVSGKSKKKDKGGNGISQKKKKKMKSKVPEPAYVELTSTLMETQEFGEMMEHVDEVNFALDGLKKGQPVRIRRASLLSLLSISGTVQQRRLLRVQGMAKTIIDAVLGLSFDDKPSNLAAAALFYILTSDGQDDYLLDSPSCIRFLIKLLKPLSSSASKEKELLVGSKFLGLCKNAGLLQESAKGTDSSSDAIILKVREILVSCKEMKAANNSDDGIEEPELNPKWISLLTLEKACLSNISIEDTSGTLRKTGGKFKEKLREFGGLDEVFEVARKCHSIMEKWLEKSPTFELDSKDISGLESLALLLKCLKIMENATFLSNDNQRHLLGMKASFDGQRAPRSFTKLVLSVIKILSGVSLLRSSLGSSQNEKMGVCSMESSQLSADPLFLKQRVESSQAGLCSGTSWNSNNATHIISSDDSDTEFGGAKRQLMCANTGVMEYGGGDPFAFDEDDFEPSKWELLSVNGKKPLSQDSRGYNKYDKNPSPTPPVSSQQESNNDCFRSQEASCSLSVDEDKSNLLSDCLLTAVKVLMNLTNDNPEGCQQIGTCGGLEILSSLIAGHFPSFSLSLPHFGDVREGGLSAKSSPLTDRELDFLVAILGLLVNLVEKDGCNRSRLAAASVSLPNLEGLDSEDQSDLISLLCSVFLANQGTGEAAGEEKQLSWEDEESILQGEKEAEKMIVEAYAALLLAFLSTESKSVRNAIAQYLPNRNLKALIPVLERFLEFHLTLNMISPETHTTVLEVIESCRII